MAVQKMVDILHIINKTINMQPVNFEGAIEIGKPKDMTDEQCMSIYAMKGVDEANFPYFLECWKPSYEDIQAINRGEPIWIKVVSNGLPPIAIWTLDETGNCMDKIKPSVLRYCRNPLPNEKHINDCTSPCGY